MIPLLFFIPLLIVGPNYDIIEIDETHNIWTSHYDRIWDDSKWVNYLTSETNDIIRFESAQIIYEFDKNDCTFRLFDPKDNSLAIEKYGKTLELNNILTPLGACIVTDRQLFEDGIKLVVEQDQSNSKIKTIYDLSALGTNEWTYELSNGDLLSSKSFTINENCVNCIVDRTQDDFIQIGKYTLDTKNRIHGTLKTIDAKKNLQLTFETNPVSIFEKSVIDPTFGYAAGSVNWLRDNSGATGTTCAKSTITNATASSPYLFYRNSGSAGNPNCMIMANWWDVSSIPDNIVSVDDIIVRVDIGTIASPFNCGITSIEGNAREDAVSTLWDDIDGTDGTTDLYVNNDSFCTTTGNDKTVDLGTDADSNLLAEINAGDDEWAIGYIFNSTRDGSDRSSVLDGPQQYFELQVEYSTSAPAVVYVTELNVNNIGDTAKINGTIHLSRPPAANITQVEFIVNGSIITTNSTTQNQTAPFTVNFGPFWYQMTTDSVYDFTINPYAQNLTETVSNSSSSVISREYAPGYAPAIINPSTQGDVNYTLIRFDNEDSVHLKVNREGGTLGETWQIECISQTNTQAIATRNQSLSWPGTWINDSNTGYFNETWNGLANTHTYVSCFNDDLLFSDVSYTNSSLALFGVSVFDSTWGAMLGVPVAVFAIVMTAGQANKRDAPTWIVVLLAFAGIMATLGFFSIEPLAWGLALLSGMLGLFVNQKVF